MKEGVQVMIRESLLDFAQANSRLKLAGLFTLSEKQAHLYSQIEGAVVSGKQLTNAVDFLQP
jgi:hypothetical protein